MFDIVDTPFSFTIIVCLSLQEFSKTKESTVRVIPNVDTAFLLCEAEMVIHFSKIYSLNVFQSQLNQCM